MRLLLAVSLVLLFLWLLKAQRSGDGKEVCGTVSMSEAVVSFLLSPLSAYSWMTSTLLRFIFTVPSLVLGALHQSLMLILAVPWCFATIFISLLLTFLHVCLYLLHMALVVGVVIILLTLTLHRKCDGDAEKENETKTPFQLKKFGDSLTKTNTRLSGHRAVQG